MANKTENDERNMTEAGDRDRQRNIGGENDRSSQNGAGRRSNRGFASMDPGKQREIASKGGRAAHAKGTAHEFDSGEAREAGRKGGVAVSRNRDHMAMIGRRGGEARGHARTRGDTEPEQSENDRNDSDRDRSAQSARGSLTDREVEIHGTGAGQANGVNTSTQGNRGGANTSLGGEARSTGGSGAAERSSNH